MSGQTVIPSQPNAPVFHLWSEISIFGENPRGHEKNMQTAHSKGPNWDRNQQEPSDSGSCEPPLVDFYTLSSSLPGYLCRYLMAFLLF